MKIAFFTESYVPYISGVTRSVDILQQSLRGLGHDVRVFAPSYPGHTDPEDNVVRIFSVPTIYPGFRLAIPFFFRVPTAIMTWCILISPFLLGIFGMLLAKKKKAKFVYSFHTLFEEYLHYTYLAKPAGVWLFRKFLSAFIGGCDCVVCPGQKAADYLSSLNTDTRIEIVPSGIDMEAVRGASGSGIRAKYSIPEKCKRYRICGAPFERKELPVPARDVQGCP